MVRDVRLVWKVGGEEERERGEDDGEGGKVWWVQRRVARRAASNTGGERGLEVGSAWGVLSGWGRCGV